MPCIMREHHLGIIWPSLEINMELKFFCDEYNHCMKSIRKPNLKTEHVNNIEQLRTLLYIRKCAYYIKGFLKPDIDTMIDYIAIYPIV